MSNYFYSSNAVDSLISYVNDIKPYHSKLTEIVEEYQFYETLNVSINDATHFAKTKIAGIWNSESYSNGLYSQIINLPFVKYPSKSSKYWNNLLEIDSKNLDQQITGLDSAYYLHHNIGLRTVKLDSAYLVEGIDFHVSHGAFTINLDGANQKFKESIFENVVGTNDKIKGFQIISESSALSYDDVKGQNGSVIGITPNLNSDAYEEWTLECVYTDVNANVSGVTYEHVQNVTSASWNIPHNLGSKDLFIQAYVFDNAYGLTPIYPSDIEFFDDNTINIKFTTARTGKVKLIKYLESDETYFEEITSPSDTWVIDHNLGSVNVIPSIKVFFEGVLKEIIPNQFKVLNKNQVEVKFTIPFTGRISIGMCESFTSAVFVQETPSASWSFENTLRVDTGIFTAYLDDGSVIFPSEVYINQNLLFVKFSKPYSGKLVFTKLFSSPNEKTIFSVTGSESGLIGYAKVGIRFNSSKIAFTIAGKDELTLFEVGEKYVLTPSNRIVSHKSYLDQESWSLIKVNPIAYLKPKFKKIGASEISNFVIKDQAVRPQTITATFNAGVFNINSSVDGNIGTCTVGGKFETSEFSFSISKEIYNPSNNDYFEFEIFNEPPSLSGLDLSLGYDLAAYDDTEYDDHFTNFDLTALGLKIESGAIPEGYFEARFNGNNTFSVTMYDNRVDRNVIKTYGDATVGVKYSNSDISFTIPGSLSYIIGDTIVCDVKNPLAYADEGEFYLHSNKFGFITLYPKSFINSPAQLWTIAVTGNNEISVRGSVTGETQKGKISESYDNGLIHFTLFQETIPYAIGDTFFIQIRDEKPSYLVYGSNTGFSKQATVGKWYWNGKIGFKLDAPTYHIHEYVSDGTNCVRDVSTGVVTLDSSNRQIEFISAPRFDAKNDIYKVSTSGFTYKGKQYFSVKSAIRGDQKGAIVNARYYDDCRPEQSVNVGSNYHDGVVDFIIQDNGIPFNQNFDITFEIRGNKFALFHANDLLILPSSIDFDSHNLLVEREVSDKFYVSTSSKYKELGVDVNSTADQWIPLYLKQSLPFSDESAQVEVFSSLINKKIGTIENIDISKDQYLFKVDDEFFKEFLPFNTKLSTKVIQSDQENSIVKARITEKLKVYDFYQFKDAVSIKIGDNASWHFGLNDLHFYDKIKVKIYDSNFRGFFAGYDIYPYSEDINGYDDSDSIQTTWFNTVAGGKDQNGEGFGGIGYLFQDKPKANLASSKISESLVIYNRITDEAISWAAPYGADGVQANIDGWNSENVDDGLPETDAYGWDNAAFDITYGLNTLTDPSIVFDAQASIGNLATPKPGSELYGSPYTNIPCALINFIRKVSTITIMKHGSNFTSIVFYSDLETQTQVPFTIIEDTQDYIIITLNQPTLGKAVIF